MEKYSVSKVHSYEAKKDYKGLFIYVLRLSRSSISARFKLAQCYENGWGCQPNLTKAVELYQRLTDQGDLSAIVNLAICYRYGKGVGQDVEKAVELYRLAAKKGSATAINNLGTCYENGTVVGADVNQAVKLYEEAANKGSFAAKVNLARCYEYGIGVERDVQLAKKLYLDAAKHDNASAQYHLGMIFSSDENPEKDVQIAAKYFELAAKQGHATAQFYIARLFEEGRGGEKNLQKAVRYYELSAKNGYAPAILNLGVCYANGTGVDKNDAKAVELYVQAAEKGNVTAQFYLGRRYDNGNGVDENLEKAVKYYSLAANQGHMEAQEKLPFAQYRLGLAYQCDEAMPDIEKALELYKLAIDGGCKEAADWLGTCYLYGMDGISEDISRSIELFEYAASLGLPRSMSRLGDLYEKGKGVKQDIFKAVQLYKNAAELDDLFAQHLLAICYFDGKGVEKNDEIAYKWFVRAAEQEYIISYIYLGFFHEKGFVVQRSNKLAIEWYTKVLAEEDFSSDNFDYIINNLRETDTLRQILSQTELLEKDKEALQKRILQLEEENRQIQAELEQKKQGELSSLQVMEMMHAFQTSLQKLEEKTTDGFARTIEAVEETSEKTVSAVEEGNKTVVKRFDEGLGDIKGSLGSIQEQLEYLREFSENTLLQEIHQARLLFKQEWLNGEKEKEELLFQISKLINASIKNKESSVSELLKEETDYLKGIFGSTWEKLCDATRRSLVSARVLWRGCSGIKDPKFDYSGICISLTAALEGELKRVFFRGLQQYLTKEYGIPTHSNIDEWPQGLLFKDKNGNYGYDNGKKTTLGSISYLLGAGRKQTLPDGDKNKESYDPLLQAKMIEYLQYLMKDTITTNAPISLFTSTESEFTHDCDLIADKYRNEAAHVGNINRKGMEICHEKTVESITVSEHQGKITSILIRLYNIVDIDKLSSLPDLPRFWR